MSSPGTDRPEDVEGSYAAGGEEPVGEEGPAPVQEWLEAVQGVIAHNATTRPYTTLIVAGAVGYVLAAGIPSVVSRAAFNAGGRMVMARLVQSLLSDQI